MTLRTQPRYQKKTSEHLPRRYNHIPNRIILILTITIWMLSVAPASAYRQPAQLDSSLTTLASSFATISITVLWSVKTARSMPPQDVLIQEILASNKTSEEKFQAVLRIQHRRYCETSRTCLGYEFGNCGYCRPCQCDERCLDYGDCCPDKLLDYADVVQPITISLACRDNLYSGYTEDQRRSRLNNATSFLMVDSCPPSASKELAQACTDPSKYLPVSLPTETKPRDVDVFANMYCAQCNGVDESDAVYWKTLLHCSSQKNITSTAGEDIAKEKADDNDCFLVYFPPPDLPPPRQCYYDNSLVTSCNVTGAWPEHDDFTERACSAYLDPKMAEGRLFQNVFCYICNSAEPDLFGFCERSPILAPMPFSALLDFSDAIYGGSKTRAVQCPNSEIFDDTTGQCRPVLCAPGRKFIDGHCSAVFGSAKGRTYSLYFSAIMDHDVDLYDGNDLLHSLPGTLEFQIMYNMLEQRVRTTSFQVSFEITDEDGRCSQMTHEFSVFATFKVMSDVNQDVFEHQILNVRNTTVSLPITRDFFLNFTTKVDEQVWLTQKHRNNQASSRSCSTTVSNFHHALPGDAEADNTRVTQLLTLPKVTLTHDEYHVQTADLGVKVTWLEEPIPLERYESTLEGKIYIALEDFIPKITAYRRALSEPDEAEVIMSIVCTSLSLLGLTLTLLTYSIFKALRTAPGKNNMNLCLTLFLAQLFYLVGSGRTEVPGLCQAMGILIHYFWLAAFAAMSVCSYHMWRVFTSFKVADDSNDQRRRFLQYTIYIWGAAAMVVVLTLLVHMIATEGDDIGYGGDICYLSTAAGVGVAVGIPVALAITASIIFFSLTVRTIRLSPKLTKSREDERHVWVYFKLSTLTGATWALAFLVFFTEVKELRYIFTLINGLQGVFVCLSFVFNRRVARLYLACCGCKGAHPGFSNATSGSGSSSSSYRNGTLSTISRRTETSFTDAGKA